MGHAFLQGDALWNTIKRLAKGSAPRWIAAPYVGKGAAALLPLGPGDALLCALTLDNSRTGSVVPSELRKLSKRGVRIFTRADLHAKVFLLGRRAIVGSANLSANSREYLDEAGVMISDREEVSAVRTWFNMRFVEPVGPEWLAVCAKAYRAAEGRRRRTTKRRWVRQVADLAGPWVIATVPDRSEDEGEQRQRDAVEEKGKTRLAHPRLNEVETLKWFGSSPFRKHVHIGDLVVEVRSEGGKRSVKPHARILARREGRSARGLPATYFAMEFPKSYRSIPRAWLDSDLRHLGLRLRRRKGRVAGRDLAFALLRMTSPDRLRR